MTSDYQHSKIPDILYKYRKFNQETLSMLRNNEIYFSPPNKLNDPFDCSPQAETLNKIREPIIKILASAYFGVEAKSLDKAKLKIFEDLFNQEPAIIKNSKEIELALADLNKLGIFSLSAQANSNPMWAHYADSHTGFCIGFNYNLHGGHARKVTYAKMPARNVLIDLLMCPQLSDCKFFFTKHIDWSYENEWRIVAESAVATYPDEPLCKIIFGLKMCNKNRGVIQEILNGKNVVFFEAVEGADSNIAIRELNT